MTTRPLSESERTGGLGDVEHATRGRAREALGEMTEQARRRGSEDREPVPLHVLGARVVAAALARRVDPACDVDPPTERDRLGDVRHLTTSGLGTRSPPDVGIVEPILRAGATRSPTGPTARRTCRARSARGLSRDAGRRGRGSLREGA